MTKDDSITQKALHEYFSYDNGNLIWKIRKGRIAKGSIAGYKQKNGYIYLQLNRKMLRIHRLIFLMHHGYMPKEIDHINRIRDDNRIENLREVTRMQNCMNASLRKDNTTNIKGVSYSKRDNMWQAYININQKRIPLGHFKSLFDACCIRKSYENKHFGDYAIKA